MTADMHVVEDNDVDGTHSLCHVTDLTAISFSVSRTRRLSVSPEDIGYVIQTCLDLGQLLYRL